VSEARVQTAVDEALSSEATNSSAPPMPSGNASVLAGRWRMRVPRCPG
jgi:hypothetical protein